MRRNRRKAPNAGPGSDAAPSRLSHRPAAAPTRAQKLGSTITGALITAAFGCTLLATSAGAAKPDDSKVKQSNEELERIRQRMQAVGQTIETDKGEQDELRAAVEVAERKVGTAQQQLKRLLAQISDQEAKVKQAEIGRAAAEAEVATQRELLTRQLRAAYVMQQGGGKAEVMFNQDDPDRVGRMLTYYDYLNRARAATIDKINVEIQRVTAQQKKYENELAALRALRTEHKRAVVELDSDRSERAQAVSLVNARIRTETQEMKRLQSNEKQVQALLTKLREALVERPTIAPHESKRAFNEMRGQHDWPLRGPILASYGDTKAGGKLQWKGLWIGSPEGTAVHATASGRIAYVGWLSSYGLIVVVDHDNGYFTLYGHNASVSKAAGDEVDAGDVIASAGNTGGYEETGLYFEVRRGTTPQDPTSWLRR